MDLIYRANARSSKHASPRLLKQQQKTKTKKIVKYKNKLMFYIDPGKRIFNKVQKFKTFLSLIL